MKKLPTLFLQAVILFIGAAVLAFLIWEPNAEGVNAHATTLADVYLDDPFLAYVYLSSIAFFVALYKAFKLLGYIRQNKILSPIALQTLRGIKRCALITAATIVGAITFLRIAALSGTDDPAGAIALGLATTLIALVGAAVAATLEQVLQSAGDKESHHIRTYGN